MPQDSTRSVPQDGALSELAADATSRKRFLKQAGAGAASGLALLLAACGSDDKGKTTSSTATSAATPAASASANQGDIAIVNYALTLEYLEADFYRQVISSGVITDAKTAELAKVIAAHEVAHVQALAKAVTALGGKPVAQPKTNFASVLAGGATKVLETAATVENLGAAAYLGQAGKIKSKEILAAALAIHSVEARHAAALNALVKRGFSGSNALEGSIPDGAFAKPMSMDQVLAAVKPFIAA